MNSTKTASKHQTQSNAHGLCPVQSCALLLHIMLLIGQATREFDVYESSSWLCCCANSSEVTDDDPAA